MQTPSKSFFMLFLYEFVGADDKFLSYKTNVEAKMKFGICGYGNLGKAVERQIKSRGVDEIVGIFSRRRVESDFHVPVFNIGSARAFSDDIDVMIMCGGSQEDLLWQSPEMLKLFNIIDTFDTHARIEEHKKNLQSVARASGKTAIYSCGWDPGLFSIARVLSRNIFDHAPQTFWGEGVSQGHSEALRNIRGVKDAIQFTVPQKKVFLRAISNPNIEIDPNDKHERVCYVCPDGTRPFDEIVEEIKNTEHYFKGQKVTVHECDQSQIDAFKKDLHHRGSVLGGDKQARLRFDVSMKSNPDFTAAIALAYAHAIPKLAGGVYSVLDVPPNLIGTNNNDQDL